MRSLIFALGICFLASTTFGAEDAFPDSVYEEVAKSIGDARSPAQIRKDNALIEAASRGDVPVLKKTLKTGADVNARYIDLNAFLSAGRSNYTALMLATSEGHLEAVRALIEAKAALDLERKGRTALYFAVFRERAEIAELLTKAGALGDAGKIRLNLALIDAACRGFEMKNGDPYPPFPGGPSTSGSNLTIKEVLVRGGDVNAADPEGYTPLMFAANLCLAENVALLLQNGADPHRKSKRGDTALSLAENQETSFNSESRKKVVDLLKESLSRKP